MVGCYFIIHFAGYGALVYKGKKNAIIILLTISLLFIVGIVELTNYSGDVLYGWLCLILGLIVWILVLLHSFVKATRYNKIKYGKNNEKGKDSYLAIALSFILPGMGQLYLRKYYQGIGFLILYVFWKVQLTEILPNFLMHLFTAYTSYLAVKEISKTTKQPIKTESLIIAVLNGSAIIKTITLIFLSTYVISIDHCEGTSMEPTLQPKDEILRDIENKKNFVRGDIIVFLDPNGRKVGKRVVALEGERVEIQEGKIYINGIRLNEGPFKKLIYSADSTTIYCKDGNPFNVPPKCIFVLGDNSKNSYDSRYYGAISEEQILGIQYKIIWPLERVKLLR